MIIQGEFYQIIPISDHALLYDLKLLYNIGGKNPRKEFKDAGYGMPLETAIKKCVQFALSQKFDTLSLKEYLIEFNKMQKDIQQNINV